MVSGLDIFFSVLAILDTRVSVACSMMESLHRSHFFNVCKLYPSCTERECIIQNVTKKRALYKALLSHQNSAVDNSSYLYTKMAKTTMILTPFDFECKC